MQWRVALPLSFCVLLTACGPSNPFADDDTTTTTTAATDDPSTTNSKFAFDADAGLTLNGVTYDADNDQLRIANLPFDGPDEVYDFVRMQNGTPIYRSRTTGTTGQVPYYAVYIKTDDVEGAAAADAIWDSDGYGFGGANVQRTAAGVPGGIGEYVYVGTYAGVRQKNDRGGLHIVTGDAELWLDVLDLEPDGNIVGSVRGEISNRVRTTETGTTRDPLPNIYLARVSFDNSDATFSEGQASTRDPDGEPRDSGAYEGIIAGASGESIGAHVVMTGPSEMQRVLYEIVEWTNEEEVTNLVNGIEVTTTVTTTGSVSGLNDDNRETITNRVDNGETVSYLTADRSGIPLGATVTSTTESAVITGDGNAREIGVIVTDRQPDN
ncbi:hypothetical protein [Pseudooceanicola sp. MF1-13]|uniref:hypothetical protein n=1 Tax=Pseudooceanicola sp. MF1-13 TaxID=3379095 RepID=UPI003891AB5D